MGKKPIVSVSYENERISIKNSLPYLKCVTSLLCGPRVDLQPFMGLPRLGTPAKRLDRSTEGKWP